MTADGAMAWLEQHEDEAVGRLMDWLRIPSVGTDPERREDTRRAGAWAADRLREVGLEVELMETGDVGAGGTGSGHPIVMAHAPGAADYDGPHVLFYGHYDVQPSDPDELWRSAPFEPVLEHRGEANEMVVARGASDDKGQVHMFLEALRAWKETSGNATNGVRMTVMLEGEEESGSVNLERFVREQRERLGACDVVLISDTGMLGPERPAITYGVRGLTYTEVTLHGPDHDLHSGMWGGKIPNPNNELVRILGQLWDADRRVAIPGFYDKVREPSAEERANWARLGVDDAAALRGIGFGPEADVGESGWTMLEREWARPTAEINGIVGGYTQPGAKTVIPTHASAKVSFRLVADQDPDEIREAFYAWLRERTPPGCRWELHDHGGGHGVTTPVESETLRAATAALERASGKKPELIKSGGSIPVAGLLKAELGLDTIFMGFGLEDDRVHSPNEKFELRCWRMGARAHAALLEALRG